MNARVGRKVLKAALEASFHLPGFGTLNKEVTSQTNAVSKAIDMTFEGDVVCMKIKDRASRQVIELLIPVNRFTYLELEKDTIKPLDKPYLK